MSERLKQQWTLMSRRVVSEHRIFALEEHRYRFETRGVEHDFVVLESRDWINVIPITTDGHVVLIKQYRHGTQDVTLEIPGGLVDVGEDAARAAARELREETGYAAAQIRLLGSVRPNPAVQSNRLHCFVAEGCHLVGHPEPDPFEAIEVLTVPLTDIPRLVQSGTIDHALVIVGFALLGLWR